MGTADKRFASTYAYDQYEVEYKGVPINRERDARLLSTETPFAIPRAPLKGWNGGVAELIRISHSKAPQWIDREKAIGFLYQNASAAVTVLEVDLTHTARGEVLVWARYLFDEDDGSPMLLAIMSQRGQLLAQDSQAPGGARCALFHYPSVEGQLIKEWAAHLRHLRIMRLDLKRREREMKRLFQTPLEGSEPAIQQLLMRELASVDAEAAALKRAANTLSLNLSNPAKYLTTPPPLFPASDVDDSDDDQRRPSSSNKD